MTPLQCGLAIRSDFPIFQRKIHGHELVYLDSAASSLKPKVVQDRVAYYYSHQCVNVHRGLYSLSEEVSSDYEAVRKVVADFIGAQTQEIVFTSGTTDSINIVANGLRHHIKSDDRIVITAMEHHANIVPWQMLGESTGCKIEVIPLTPELDIDLDRAKDILELPNIKLFACTWVSNVIGTINPIQELIGLAKAKGALTLVDAAQAVSHIPVDVSKLSCDFLAFSAHKLFGPTGVGILYGRSDALKILKPMRGGGDMIKSVRLEETIYAEPPHLFEAGTPNIAGVLGFGAAIDYFRQFSYEQIHQHEIQLFNQGKSMLQDINGLEFVGSPKKQASLMSFVLKGYHPHDVATILDQFAIAMRAGLHCAQPLHDLLGIGASIRLSLSVYNDVKDLDCLVQGLRRAQEILRT